jgi:hypothetical protein
VSEQTAHNNHGMIHDPELLPPGDSWGYRCHLCNDLRLQGGWGGVLWHFDVVHPDIDTPEPPPPPPLVPEQPRRPLVAVRGSGDADARPRPPVRPTAPPGAVQDALFDVPDDPTTP